MTNRFDHIIEKYAADSVGGGIMEAGLGLGVMRASLPYVTGTAKMYHGTSKDAWEKIKNDGIRARASSDDIVGGTANFMSSDPFRAAYARDGGKNHAYFTPSKALANSYTHQAVQTLDDIDETDPKTIMKMLLTENRDGKRIVVRVPMAEVIDAGKEYKQVLADNPMLHYDMNEKMKFADMDLGGRVGFDPDLGPLAYRMNHVPTEMIDGANAPIGKRLALGAKNFGKMVTKHPSKFTLGVAGLGLGGAMVADGTGLNKIASGRFDHIINKYIE